MQLKTIFMSLFTLFTVMMSSQSVAQAKNSTKSIEPVAVEQVQAPAVISEKVNVNTASATELQKALVGVGAKKAQAIVEYREKHGVFTAAEQLLEVQGIGKSILEKNRNRILL